MPEYSHIISLVILTHFSLIDKHCNDYNKLRKPQVKQHMTTLVNRGIVMNFMNAFPKPSFVKDIYYMNDSIALIY